MIATLSALTSLLIVSSAYVLEHFFAMEPCSLCLIERLLFVFVGLGFLLYHIPVPHFRKGIVICTSLMILLGLSTSGFHIFLQYAPPDRFSCGPSLTYLSEQLPFWKALLQFLQAPGSCAETGFTILLLPLSHWAFLFFLLLGGACVTLWKSP